MIANISIDLNQLRVFVAVAELGTMTKAAKALKMPISRVSRTVARLETALGTTLITRTTRNLHISEAGRRLQQATRPLMLRLAAIESEFQSSESAIAGPVRITAPEDIGGAIVAPMIAEISSLYPALQIELICSDERFDLVQAGIDLAIRIGKMQDSTLRSRRLGGISLCCVAAPRYLDRAGIPKIPSDLGQHDCIELALGSSSPMRTWKLSNGRQQLAVNVAPRLTTNHTGAAIAFLLAGRGISCIPAPMAVDYLKSGALIRVLPSWSFGSIPVNIVFPAQRNMAARIKAVIQYLEERLAPYF